MRSPDYRAGVWAALGAEAVFIAVVATMAVARGRDPLMVLRILATFVLGPEAVQPSGSIGGAVAIGLLIHLLMSVVVGVIYATLLPRLRISPVAGGLITGAVLYTLGFWVLPLLFPAWLLPFWLPPTGKLLQAVAHAGYGWVFGRTFAWLEHRR